jgi:DHA1 family bicyclomycin/chloramphenicol resistance-like MFS transporter
MAGMGGIAAMLSQAGVPPDILDSKKWEPPRKIIEDYVVSLRDRSYLMCAVAIGLGSMAHVVFISYSAFPLERDQAVRPSLFGIFLSITAVGYILGTTIARRLFKSRSISHLLTLASILCFAGSVLLVAATIAAPVQPLAIIAPMMIVMFGVGITIPVSQAGLLQSITSNGGNASGLFFFIQLTVATTYSLMVGQVPHMTASYLAASVAAPCTLFAAAMWWQQIWKFRRGQRLAGPQQATGWHQKDPQTHVKEIEAK